jgi:hypothetical protein
VSIIVLLHIRRTRFWDRIYENYQEELKSIRNEYLLWVFENHMIIWNLPTGRIVFQCLRILVLQIGQEMLIIPY